MAKKSGYGQKAVKIMELLNKDPSYADAYVAVQVGCRPSYVYALRKKMAHAAQEETKGATTEAKPTSVRIKETIASWRKEAEATDVDTILDQRADQYGSFMASANVAIRLKGVMHNAIAQQDLHLAPDQLLSLDMIAVKISRILTGNPSHLDSWMDIAGYAKLVADRLQGTVR